MNVNDVYKSRGDYLKACDLKQDTEVQISGVAVESVGEGADARKQIVLSFEGTDKRLGLNKTNATTLTDDLGVECDAWVGRRITLYNDPTVELKGKRVGGVRIRPQQNNTQQPVAAGTGDSLPF